MVRVETPTETVTYAYDDDNIRVSETKGGVTTNYLLDKNLPYAQVLAEYANGSLEASYTYGLDLIEQERNSQESYYLVDGLGSTKALTDENGQVTDTYLYDAYGNLIGSAGSTENDYRFAGEQFDETLGQYYLRQRYYDPSSGRFTRRHTYEGRFGEPITLHKYLYANSNPVNGIDPSGLSTLTEINSIFAQIGQMAARSLATPIRLVPKLVTALEIALFLAAYGVFLAATTSGGESEDDEFEDDEYEEDLEQKAKGKKPNKPKPKGKTPSTNQAQNKAFDDAIKAINRIRGKLLSKTQVRRLYEEISGQGYDYHEIIEEGLRMFPP